MNGFRRLWSRGFVFLSLFLICIAGARAAEQGGRKGIMRVRQLTSAQYPYLAILPADFNQPGQKWPLIVFLHGGDQRGRNFDLLKVNGPPRTALRETDFPFVVVAPQLAEGKLWEPDAVASFVKRIIPRFRIDASRVYLTGLSTGGYGTWAAGLKYPERFAAIVPVAGGGDTVYLKHAEGVYHEHLKGLGVWAFHGGADPVIDASESTRLVDELRSLGVRDARATIYGGVGHDIWDRVYDDPALYEWLLSKQR
jgi:predicted peptidase